MSKKYVLKNAAGDTVEVSKGSSALFFFFGSLFGIPYFMKKMIGMGIAGLVIGTVSIVLTLGSRSTSDDITIIMSFVQLAFGIFGCTQGNKMLLNKYLAKGYSIVEDPDAPDATPKSDEAAPAPTPTPTGGAAPAEEQESAQDQTAVGKFCTRCGGKLPKPSGKYCPHCGGQV